MRPDIALAVHKVTRQTHVPRALDWSLAKRIACYLKGTATLNITMKLSRGDIAAPRLDAFSDADFAGDRADKKSVTGGMLLLNGMPVSWGARKQGCYRRWMRIFWSPARLRGKCKRCERG
uniref:Uncharacterized protein n=1 Tax=Peronospora matthiolae TaxID=2874970 RepID=A0AAV1TTV9_9STRA